MTAAGNSRKKPFPLVYLYWDFVLIRQASIRFEDKLHLRLISRINQSE